jgi:predicted RNA binding protein YcfA (HicA-like mRNA interferase family)
MFNKKWSDATMGLLKRTELIRALRLLGWEGSYAGGNHQYMVRGTQRIALPNPHQGDIGESLLARILRQAGINKETWKHA